MKTVLIKNKRTGKPYKPHKFQQEVHNSKARFRIVVAGRRWGKTLMSLMDMLRFMIEHPGCMCYWVVPKYKHLIAVSKSIRDWIPLELVKTQYQLQQLYRYIELHNGAKVWFHSCEDPDSLRGVGLDYVVMEEAAMMRDEVWSAIIRPTLIDSGGKALIITTPKGKNWVYKEFLLAKSGEFPEYECWQRSSLDRLSKEELEKERATIPEDIFRQEFLAEFIDSGGSVFRNVRKCFKGDIDEERFKVVRYSDGMRMVPRRPIDEFVYIGADLGRHKDFTVFTAIDSNGFMVGFERFTRIHVPLQKERFKAFLSHFPRRRVVIDRRGIGEGFFDELRHEGIVMEGLKLTNQDKNELIHNLIIKLDEEEIHGPFIPELVEELEAFEFKISHAGNVIYSAPENWHDDCVMSLCLAAKHLRKRVTSWVMYTGKGFMEGVME